MSTHESVIHGDRIFEIVDSCGRFGIKWTYMYEENIGGVISGLYPSVDVAMKVLAEFTKTK